MIELTIRRREGNFNHNSPTPSRSAAQHLSFHTLHLGLSFNIPRLDRLSSWQPLFPTLPNGLRIPKDVLGIPHSFELAQSLNQARTIVQFVRLLPRVSRVNIVEIRRVLWQVIRHGVVELVDKRYARLGKRRVEGRTSICIVGQFRHLLSHENQDSQF